MTSKELTIYSGGQTGVDRAALDAAMQHGYACAGWCPSGRKAEDGRIPDYYPLAELEKGGYRERTIRNLRQTDGTVIIFFDELSGGTKLTADSCVRYQVPHILINANVLDPVNAASEISTFIKANSIGTMNVAGPRASGHPRAYDYTYAAICQLLA